MNADASVSFVATVIAIRALSALRTSDSTDEDESYYVCENVLYLLFQSAIAIAADQCPESAQELLVWMHEIWDCKQLEELDAVAIKEMKSAQALMDGASQISFTSKGGDA